MNISIHKQPSFRPQNAIIFYRGSEKYNVATFHKIHENGELGVGKNVDINDFEELFRSNGRSSMKYLPENVLAMKNNTIVWYEKSRKHKIFFDIAGNSRQELNMNSGTEVVWPALLFMIRQNILYCRALRNDQRPTLRTPIYIAPLLNINDATGQVCLPNGLKLHSGVHPLDNMHIVSESFYDGIFSHGGNYYSFWMKYLKKEKHTVFPSRILKPANQNLEDFLS